MASSPKSSYTLHWVRPKEVVKMLITSLNVLRYTSISKIFNNILYNSCMHSFFTLCNSRYTNKCGDWIIHPFSLCIGILKNQTLITKWKISNGGKGWKPWETNKLENSTFKCFKLCEMNIYIKLEVNLEKNPLIV